VAEYFDTVAGRDVRTIKADADVGGVLLAKSSERKMNVIKERCNKAARNLANVKHLCLGAIYHYCYVCFKGRFHYVPFHFSLKNHRHCAIDRLVYQEQSVAMDRS
jgi:hypothetical protein